jgi:hypothetical protein
MCRFATNPRKLIYIIINYMSLNSRTMCDWQSALLFPCRICLRIFFNCTLIFYWLSSVKIFDNHFSVPSKKVKDKLFSSLHEQLIIIEYIFNYCWVNIKTSVLRNIDFYLCLHLYHVNTRKDTFFSVMFFMNIQRFSYKK